MVPLDKIDNIEAVSDIFEELKPRNKDENKETMRYWFEINWGEIEAETSEDANKILLQMVTVVKNKREGEGDIFSSY